MFWDPNMHVKTMKDSGTNIPLLSNEPVQAVKLCHMVFITASIPLDPHVSYNKKSKRKVPTGTIPARALFSLDGGTSPTGAKS
jgi:hypothetical protein